MARFADYVKEDQLEEEIAAADQQEQVRETESGIPDRFKGKSAAEIAQSYIELEKLNSRQAQDLGAMRKTVDTLVLELQPNRPSDSQGSQTEEPSDPVTVDELYEKPDETIRRTARQEAAGQIKTVQKDLAALRAAQAMAQFDAAHPGWRDTAAAPEFRNWVTEAPYRLRLAGDADTGNLDAADALLSMYKEYSDVRAREKQAADEQEKRATRGRDLRAATLETSGPIPHESIETFSRSDLLTKRLAAKRGDSQADHYLRVNGEKIRLAYAENRVTD